MGKHSPKRNAGGVGKLKPGRGVMRTKPSHRPTAKKGGSGCALVVAAVAVGGPVLAILAATGRLPV